MNPCPGCLEASKDARTPFFGSIAGADSCPECKARSLANGQPFFESSRSGQMTPTYKAALLCVFGSDWAEGHEKCKAWSEKIKAAR